MNFVHNLISPLANCVVESGHCLKFSKYVCMRLFDSLPTYFFLSPSPFGIKLQARFVSFILNFSSHKSRPFSVAVDNFMIEEQ
ncbi:hypothetical protein L1887_10081 [Cichorium endivia]|nr:hypothetical protein L1887_10081 [Cichorium endivia]